MGMMDFKTRDRTHMYVTTHDTFAYVHYIAYDKSSTLQLFRKMWPSWVSTMAPSYRWPTP